MQKQFTELIVTNAAQPLLVAFGRWHESAQSQAAEIPTM